MLKKKVIISSLLLSGMAHVALASDLEPQAAASAESKSQNSQTILGIDIFKGDSKISATANGFSASQKFDRGGVRLKFGAKKASGARFEGYLEIEDYDAFDNSVVGFGGNIRYAYGDESTFMPFWKVGASIGSTELEDDVFVQFEDESLGYVGFVAGLGLEKKLSPKADFLLGLDIGKRYWQDIEFRDQFNNRIVVEQDDTPLRFYIGLNFGI